jgi:hypothetical protein
MPWKLIFLLIVLAIVLVFVGLNLGNTSDISLGFVDFEDVPVFMGLFIAFFLGVAVAIPISMSSSSRKTKARSEKRFEKRRRKEEKKRLAAQASSKPTGSVPSIPAEKPSKK